MSQSQIWLSITLWAVSAIVVAVVSHLILFAFYPSLPLGALVLTSMLAVYAVYAVRSFARRRGWAMTSYKSAAN